MSEPLPELEAVLAELVRPMLERMVEEAVAARVPEPSPWYSTRGAAEYLGVTPQAVRERVYRGKLKAHYDAGRKLRFRRSDLDDSMRSRR